MDEVSFTLSGFDDLKRTLEELGTESATKIGTTATREAAKLVKDAFVEAAPVGTEPTAKTRRTRGGKVVAFDYGHLKANIRLRKARADSPNQVKFSVGVGRAFWGLIQEFGSRHAPAKPWLRPAFDTVAGRVVDELGRLIGIGITREGRRLARIAKKAGR